MDALKKLAEETARKRKALSDKGLKVWRWKGMFMVRSIWGFMVRARSM